MTPADALAQIEAELAAVQADLDAYKQRDNSDYYGLLVRLQTTYFEHGPALLTYLAALVKVAQVVPELLDWMERYRGGDETLAPEEYYIRRDDACALLDALVKAVEP